MSQPFIGEIRMVGFNFPPRGWAQCDGQLLPIAQNAALFSILGTTYGGNGVNNFALPDLRGRTAMHWGTGNGLPAVALGQKAGEEAHTLTGAETAAHGHQMNATSAAANTGLPSGNFLAATSVNQYVGGNPTTALSAATIQPPAASGQPHPNLQPYQVVLFCIALVGIFPSRN